MGFLQEHKDRLKNFLDKLTNDAHVPIAIFVFCVTFAYCAKTGKDLQPGFVSSLYAFYGFLGGHALVYQKWPDANAPTTVVNVDNTNSANANASPTPTPAPAAPDASTGSGG
jgi:hypothetical protein